VVTTADTDDIQHHTPVVDLTVDGSEEEVVRVCQYIVGTCLTYSYQVKVIEGKFLTKKECQKTYAAYAMKIDSKWFDVVLTSPGETHGIIGANKSYRSGIDGVIPRTITMKTTEWKFRVVVYRGEGVKYIQGSFELGVSHKQEVLRVLRERATGAVQEKVFYVENEEYTDRIPWTSPKDSLR
jgi:hypothetical protein